jgi:putative transposase
LADSDSCACQLFTFTAFPISQWKALRTTNALERINEEFRRRTQNPSFAPQRRGGAALAFWPPAPGQVALRRGVGWQDLTTISEQPEAA